MPMWIQEVLHHRWLDHIVLLAQPQGADEMQRDVDRCLHRTNTQAGNPSHRLGLGSREALLNCSFGRDWDEQHCWFAGFFLEPKARGRPVLVCGWQVALECDSMLPLGPGRPKVSGWLALKSRIARQAGPLDSSYRRRQVGITVITLHDCFWRHLTEERLVFELSNLA